MSPPGAACYLKREVHARERPFPARAGDIVLRDAREDDFDALLALWRELMDLHVELDDRFDLSDNADQRFFNYVDTAQSRDDYRVRLAVHREEIVGFAIACVLPNSPVYRARWIGYINDLCVTASMRRRGVGELLVHDAVAWLRQCGAESVEVYVAHHNAVAQRFWRRIGGTEYLERLSLDLTRFEPGARD